MTPLVSVVVVPILAFATSKADLHPTLSTHGRRTLIQVSSHAQAAIEQAIDAVERFYEPGRVGELCALAVQRELDSELMLLVRAIETHGKVYVRFL